MCHYAYGTDRVSERKNEVKNYIIQSLAIKYNNIFNSTITYNSNNNDINNSNATTTTSSNDNNNLHNNLPNTSNKNDK